MPGLRGGDACDNQMMAMVHPSEDTDAPHTPDQFHGGRIPYLFSRVNSDKFPLFVMQYGSLALYIARADLTDHDYLYIQPTISRAVALSVEAIGIGFPPFIEPTRMEEGPFATVVWITFTA